MTEPRDPLSEPDPVPPEHADAAALVATPVEPLGPDVVDDLIAAALDAPVAPARPRRRRSAVAPWMVAAAVVALVFVGLGLIWTGRDQGSDDLSQGEVAEETADSDAAERTAEPVPTTMAPLLDSHTGGQDKADAPPSSEEGTASTTAPEAVDLGAFDDGDDLRVALATSFAPEPATDFESAGETPSPESLDRCEQQVRVALSLEGELSAQGYATVDEDPVLVYEFESTSYQDGSETTLVVAVGKDACEQVTVFER